MTVCRPVCVPAVVSYLPLNSVSFNVNEGEFTVIGGSNGSGKSILMSIIAGLETQTSGIVEIYENGLCTENNSSITDTTISNRLDIPSLTVGLIFQDADAQIMGETPEEDIAFGPKNMGLSKIEVKERTTNALNIVGLEHKRNSPARFMSGGEKRRLSVAGILAMNCSFFIFDEPFANLDWPGVEQVCNIMKELKDQGKTIIVLTNELEKLLRSEGRRVGKLC